ncbi:MAG: (2Fe-2S)-binding protein [Acidobacteria bacterium]|nr:(2Fe-2S)-binding protein [Acidobacteriota bacterium]
MDTVTLTIDGREMTVEKGKTVLQAAIEAGISLPYYCYHPALGVDGSCRVCIVKVEKMPKLQTSCSTICTDGMVVWTRTPEVEEARASVFEFLLINHPLDCPVCDKGGECPLQDFSYTYGPAHSRMEFQRRVFDGEGARADVDFGPTLILNRNRCILCTRCVRFMRDVDGDAQINIVDRAYGSEIATFQEEGVHSLLSGNLMDVCPVGAILTRDYRFKSRPWDNPQATDTICTFCSRGCNTTVWIKAKPEWAKGPQLARITPRLNPEVNGYWMCDIGRFEDHWIEGEDRVRVPMRRAQDGSLQPADWPDVMASVRDNLQAAGGETTAPTFLVSAHASLEELFLLKKLQAGLARGGSTPDIVVSWRYREKEQPSNTRFKVPAVEAPNVTGARDLGLIPEAGGEQPDLEDLRLAVERRGVQALYVFDPGPDGSLGDVGWLVDARRRGLIPLLLFQGVLLTDLAREADFILPGASSVEKDASYTNRDGRVQGASRAMAPPGQAMEDWQVLVNLAITLGVPLPYTASAHVRADLAAEMQQSDRYRDLAQLTFARPLAARTWLQVSNPSERWKWDFLFQDLPPVKFAGDPTDTFRRGVIAVTPAKEEPITR